MKTEKPGVIEKNQERRAGIFIFITIITVLIIFFVIGKDKKVFKAKYNLITTFDHGGNIDKNTAITLAGLNVGNVKEIYINDENKINVVMAIQDEYRRLIKKDSGATLFHSLLTGSVIDISIGSKDSDVLEDGDYITSAEAEEIADKVAIKILLQKSDALGDLIKNDLPLMFEKSAEAFEKLDKVFERLDKPSSEINKLIKNLESLTNKLNKSSMLDKGELFLNKGVDLLDNGVDIMGKSGQMLKKGEVVLSNAEILTNNAIKTLPPLLAKFEIFLEEYNTVLDILKDKAPEFPEIIESVESFMFEINDVMDAAKKSFLLRKHIDKTNEQIMINEDVRDFLFENG